MAKPGYCITMEGAETTSENLMLSVEEEPRRRKQSVDSAPHAVKSWKNGPPGVGQQSPAPPKKNLMVVAKTETTMSDVVMGKRLVVQSTKVPPVENLTKSLSRVEEATSSIEFPKKVHDDDAEREYMGTKHTKSHMAIAADQNTAQTYQETVSASSNA